MFAKPPGWKFAAQESVGCGFWAEGRLLGRRRGTVDACLEAQGRLEAESLYASADSASAGLKPGSWEILWALTWIARAAGTGPNKRGSHPVN